MDKAQARGEVPQEMETKKFPKKGKEDAGAGLVKAVRVWDLHKKSPYCLLKKIYTKENVKKRKVTIMKIAITSQGPKLSDNIDPRFGRASYIIIADTEKDEFESIDNELNLNAASGAGIQTSQNISKQNVKAVITGNVGPNAYKTLNAAGIKVFLTDICSVSEAITNFKNNKLSEADNANVEGHW